MKAGMASLLTVVVVAGIATIGVEAQKGKPSPPTVTGGPSDAVFRDFDADRIRSDGYMGGTCASVTSEERRYCGGTYTENGLTYVGVGPECSRISYDNSGSYAFRTRSSKCDFTAATELRSLALDFSERSGYLVRCENADSTDDVIARTVNGQTRVLNVCGPNLIDDVQILADGMFTASTAVVTLHISLHAPPDANTTQFLLEFSAPLTVTYGQGYRVLTAQPGDTAVLWEMVAGKGGKLQKAPTPVGHYHMPFSLKARNTPIP